MGRRGRVAVSIRRDWFKTKVELLSKAGVNPTEAFRSAFGMDPNLALALPFADFLNMACRDVKPSPELLDSLSRFFDGWAEVLESSGLGDEAALARGKAAEARALK